MISILSRLVCPVMRRAKCGSYVSILNNRGNCQRVATQDQEDCTDRLIYRTRLAFPPDYDNVLNFMCCTFFRDDPNMINIGLDKEEPSPLLVKLIYDGICEGMTIIAEGQDDSILGVVVNMGCCSWDPDKLLKLACCECGPVRDLIEFEAYVCRKPNLWERYCISKIFECSYIAVDPDLRDRGIAKKLLLDSWYLARDCTYRLFRIDCNNKFAARIATGFGWQRVCCIPYHQYVKNHQVVFKYIKEPHTEVEVYVDQITHRKSYCLPYKKHETTITKGNC